MRDSPNGGPFPPDASGSLFAGMREVAAEILRANPDASLGELNAALQVRVAATNRRPQAELGGLAPAQVANLLSADWERGDGALRLNSTLPLDSLADARTLVNARTLLALLEERGEVRATGAGNLPRAAVADLVERMEWPDGFLEDLHRYNKVLNEDDVFPLHVLRVLLGLAGLLKLRKGRFSRTRRGADLAAESRAGELFALLFRTQFRTMNLGYLNPRLPDAPIFQRTVAFSLHRFGQVAKGWKTPEELARPILLPVVRAEVPPGPWGDRLPWMIESQLLRPLVGFGLAEVREVPRKERLSPNHAYRKTRLFDRFLSWDLSAQGMGGGRSPAPKRERAPRAAKDKTKPAGDSIHQLRVTLLDTDPPVWRRIQLRADTTLGELHAILQEAMGWTNSHLHKFVVGRTEYGPRFAGLGFRNEDQTLLCQVAPKEGSVLMYEYDFGDSWEHEVGVEEVLPGEPGARYPRCVAAERAGPPEDCGGVWGYEELLEVLADPEHPEYEERLDWLGGAWDPEAVDIEEINRRLARLG